MADSIFASLGLGIAFDKNRFKKEVDLFEGKASGAVHGGAQPSQVPSAPPAEQGEREGASEEHKKKRRKKTQQPQQQAGTSIEASGIALFSGAAAAAAAAAKAGEGAGAREGDDAPLFTDDTPEVHTRDPFEEANVVRKSHRIKVSGSAPPAPLRSFQDLADRHSAPKRLLSNLAGAGFREPTPIQRQAVTALLAGRELLAIAPTGSGKTLAFLLPLIMRCRALRREHPEEAGVKAVVVSPTKELMMQSGRVLKLLLPGLGLRASILTKATAAGTNFDKVDILLANPLRLGAMAGQEAKLDLSHVRTLILDEADKLFGMGFTEQIDAVLAACSHKDVVRGLFSATLPEQVEQLARSVLQDPLRVTVGERNTAAASVAQRLLFVGREAGKLLALRQLIGQGLKPPVLVFVATKERAKELHRELMFDGVHVDSIHADQSQAARQAAVDNFRLGRTWVLIATDLIGRGMDFLGVNTVINYDFPNSTTDYIHRIGRTGRAGRAGEAITFFMEEDSGQLRGIANVMKAAGCEVPDWMLQLKKEKRRRRAPVPGGISTEPQAQARAAKRAKREEGSKGLGQKAKDGKGGAGGRGAAAGGQRGGKGAKAKKAAAGRRPGPAGGKGKGGSRKQAAA